MVTIYIYSMCIEFKCGFTFILVKKKDCFTLNNDFLNTLRSSFMVNAFAFIAHKMRQVCAERSVR